MLAKMNFSDQGVPQPDYVSAQVVFTQIKDDSHSKSYLKAETLWLLEQIEKRHLLTDKLHLE